MHTSRRITNLLLAMMAVILAIVAQSCIIRGRGGPGPAMNSYLRDGLLLYAAAAALFVVSTRPVPVAIPALPPSRAMPGGRRLRAGMILLVAAPLIGTTALLFFEKPTRPWLPWSLYAASLLSFLVAVYFLDRTLPTPRSSIRPSLVLLLAILLLAFFFRLYRFNSIPFGTWYDEADGGLHALRVLEDSNSTMLN